MLFYTLSEMSQSSRILDRTAYDRRTIITYEMIAAFYTDMFYNHLYFEAKRIKNDGNVSSITEGYKHTLNAFLQGMSDPKLYKKSLLGMHTYFIDNGFRTLTFSQCIDRIIIEFIPDDFIDSITSAKKSSILHLVLSNVTTNFIYKIISSYLGMIIDNHKEADNARVLQEEFIDLLLIERNNMFKKFIGGSSKRKTIDISIIEDMQKEIKAHLSEKYNLKKNITDLKKVILFKESKYNQALEKIQELTDKINDLQNELEESKVLTAINLQDVNADSHNQDNIINSHDQNIITAHNQDISLNAHSDEFNETKITEESNINDMLNGEISSELIEINGNTNDSDDEVIIEPMNKPDNIFEDEKKPIEISDEIIWNE